MWHLGGLRRPPQICDYGRARLVFLRTELGLELRNGIPSEDTLERILKHLLPRELEQSLRACAGVVTGYLAAKHVCIDGKEHRGTVPAGARHALIQTVSVWVAKAQLSFGQGQVGAKTNEKTAIPLLLDTLDVAGSVITIDAIACQQSLVTNLVTNLVARGADYVIALKKNQKHLFEQVSERLLAQAPHLPAHTVRELGHGRGERRMVRISQDLTLLEACAPWAGLRTLVLVETARHTATGTTHTQRFYLSSLTDPGPATYARLVRQHWSIENQLHWQLDVTFREDQCRLRTGNAALNANILRKIALYLLIQTLENIGKKRKRKRAAYDNDFLVSILKLA